MISKVEQEILNRRLKDRMGCEFDGRPKFRLTWSTDQTELRAGTFNIFSPSGKIFLREETGVKEMKKYPHVPDRWVLEVLVFDPCVELIGSRNGTYEPIYIFQTATGEYLEPVWRAIDMMCYFWLNPQPKKTAADFIQDERDLEREEVEYFQSLLDNEGRSPMFAFENSAFISSNRQKFWDRSSK